MADCNFTQVRQLQTFDFGRIAERKELPKNNTSIAIVVSTCGTLFQIVDVRSREIHLGSVHQIHECMPILHCKLVEIDGHRPPQYWFEDGVASLVTTQDVDVIFFGEKEHQAA